ncbi:MAG: hypothetical protein CMH27_05005 [Micavibrio sp.]|nr:hypothetical protein [Micavibrio sp.]|tara:strand:+ start:423 stop:1088 length:666 start_codon:yes stop_codon:yes gene_type:complete
MHYSEIFQALADHIQNNIDETKRDIGTAHMPTQAQKEKLRKAAEDLNFLHAIQVKLPASLEFCSLPSRRVDHAVSQKLRREFRNSVKSAFIEATAYNPKNKKALLDMKLTESEIKTLSAHGLVRDIERDGRHLDIIVDHIHDLTLGGENEFDNFMLIPDYINQIKSRLIHVQERIAPEYPERLSIKPQGGAAVPFIETGFRPRETGTQLCQQVNTFLGLEL